MPQPLLLDAGVENKGSFVEALGNPSPLGRKGSILGENGQAEISLKYMCSSAEGALVAIYGGLLRDSSIDKVKELLTGFIRSLEDLAEGKRADYARYLVCLIFYTRDCRGGKGERNIFRSLFLESYRYFPKTIESLVQHIPTYGYWKDLNEILVDISDSTADVNFEQLKNTIYAIMADQLRIDSDNYNLFILDNKTANESGENYNKKLHLTLVAKYSPKEGGSYDRKMKAAKELAMRLFPLEFKTDFRMALKSYRKMVSMLNQAIRTTEVLMCQKRFSEIQFKLVPGKCLLKYRCAFLNTISGGDEFRYPNDNDRMTCRANILKFMEDVKNGKKRMNVGQLFIHEIVEKIVNHNNGSKNLTEEELELCELAWNEIIKTYQEQLEKGEIKLNKGVVMADVSGSMNGTPMMVSIASALFISNFVNEPYRHRFITFDTTPKWLYVEPNLKLVDKIKIIMNSPWGGSTNFEKAMNLILDAAVKFSLQPNELPEWFLLVSDMQFDSANSNSNWETMHEHIQETFRTVGIKTCGKPYQVPHFIYWNVRGDTNGLPVVSSELGCQIVSGYSIAILKEIFKNQDLTNITPWSNLQSTLDGTRYEIIRNNVSSIAEEPYFSYYSQTQPDIIHKKEILPEPTQSSGIFSFISSFFK
jgi:hypothetical protein